MGLADAPGGQMPSAQGGLVIKIGRGYRALAAGVFTASAAPVAVHGDATVRPIS